MHLETGQVHTWKLIEYSKFWGDITLRTILGAEQLPVEYGAPLELIMESNNK